MYSTNSSTAFQVSNESNNGLLFIPSSLPGFTQSGVYSRIDASGNHSIYQCDGVLCEVTDEERICPVCGQKMHIKSSRSITLRHLPFGLTYIHVTVKVQRLFCENGHHTQMRSIPFRAQKHTITTALESYIEDLLASGCYTLKEIAELTGVGAHLVGEIDKARLSRLYTDQTELGPVLKKPDTCSRYLAIDEFKLHNGHKYATHIIDLETGHVLWIARGKKKQVVYDFIDHAGIEWMSHVQTVACDMNSDFQEAFQDRCPWISIVFDYFHIVKNFNDKVVSEVRKDVQRELIASGEIEQARLLKGAKYILMSSKATLASKDAKGKAGAMMGGENTLFGLKPVLAKTGFVKRYNELLKVNSLFMTCDLVKDQLERAFKCSDPEEMVQLLNSLIDTCKGTKNKHFKWFARLSENHYEGILSHAIYGISSEKIEGMNNKIKTVRRQAYVFKDDGYFFLKIIDASRNPSTKNPKFHKIFHRTIFLVKMSQK